MNLLRFFLWIPKLMQAWSTRVPISFWADQQESVWSLTYVILPFHFSPDKEKPFRYFDGWSLLGKISQIHPKKRKGVSPVLVLVLVLIHQQQNIYTLFLLCIKFGIYLIFVQLGNWLLRDYSDKNIHQNNDLLNIKKSILFRNSLGELLPLRED